MYKKTHGRLMFESIIQENVGYSIWKFTNIFSKIDFDNLQENSKKFDYALISGHRTDRKQRIWMHQYKEFDKIAKFFDSYDTKFYLGSITGTSYVNTRTRIELCLDKQGSWLTTHTDDAAKLFTMQIYLSNTNGSTAFQDKITCAKENCGWFFNNTGNEYHSLAPLLSDRISIIVNYVDNNWKDNTVLV